MGALKMRDWNMQDQNFMVKITKYQPGTCNALRIRLTNSLKMSSDKQNTPLVTRATVRHRISALNHCLSWFNIRGAGLMSVIAERLAESRHGV